MKYRKPKIHSVVLSAEQRENLLHRITTDCFSVTETKRAYVLLYADEGPMGSRLTDSEISIKIGLHRMTILKVRHKFVRQGLEEAVKTIREEKNQKKQVSSANNNPDHDLHSAHDWLSMSAATTLFGLPAKGIYRLVRRGILKQVKLIHKRIHVSRIEIERLMVMGEDSSDYRQSLSPLPRLSADE